MLRDAKNAKFTNVINEDEEDFVLEDNDEEGNYQVDQMNKMEENRGGKSPKRSNVLSDFGRASLQSASTRIIDLTSDPLGYGIRPSTAI
jgi:hypothetical protein